jgi:hypothetical protein
MKRTVLNRKRQLTLTLEISGPTKDKDDMVFYLALQPAGGIPTAREKTASLACAGVRVDGRNPHHRVRSVRKAPPWLPSTVPRAVSAARVHWREVQRRSPPPQRRGRPPWPPPLRALGLVGKRKQRERVGYGNRRLLPIDRAAGRHGRRRCCGRRADERREGEKSNE